MSSPPPIVAVSGSQDFLRRRHVAMTVAAQRKNGWDIITVDGSDTFGLQSALSGGGSSAFGDSDKPTMVVLKNAEKADLAVLEGHAKNPTSTVVLLDCDGDPKAGTKFGKFVLALPPKAQANFPIPAKWWEVPTEAAKFAVAESRRLERPMAEDLAKSLVARCGTDYGFLSFEVQKFALLAEARGETTIRVNEVRDAMAPFGEQAFDTVKDALATRTKKHVAVALERTRKQATKDPTMNLCGALETLVMGKKDATRSTVGWLHLTTLVAQGVSPEDIAFRLEINPWRCKTTLLPEVRMWKPADTIAIVHAAATTRRAIVSGAIDPWITLTASLLALCPR